jgi:hypothetical protein
MPVAGRDTRHGVVPAPQHHSLRRQTLRRRKGVVGKVNGWEYLCLEINGYIQQGGNTRWHGSK